jgi:hypothetical protein
MLKVIPGKHWLMEEQHCLQSPLPQLDWPLESTTVAQKDDVQRELVAPGTGTKTTYSTALRHHAGRGRSTGRICHRRHGGVGKVH